MKSLLFLAALFLLSIPAHCQTETLIKDLKCFDQLAYSNFDLLTASRENGAYDFVAEWSERVSSSQIVKQVYPLEGDNDYVIILSTEAGVDGSAIEIRNSRGEKLEYVYSINDIDKNQITFFYTPPLDDLYRISFRVVNNHKPLTCLYMAILKGNPTDE